MSNTPGESYRMITEFNYKKIRRPIYPLDDILRTRGGPMPWQTAERFFQDALCCFLGAARENKL